MQNNKLSAVIGSLLIGATFAGTAQAAPEASAQAVVAFENFTISSGGSQLDVSDFALISATASTKVSASVDATSVAPPQASTTDADNLAQSAVVGAIAPANIAAQFAANNTITQSEFTAADTFPMGGNFAASGANDFGSPIDNFGNASASDATLYNGSYASLTSDGTAGTQSNSGLTAGVTFVTGFSGVLTFDFDLGTYISTFLSSGDSFVAKSSWSVVFTLRDDANQAHQIDLGILGTGPINLGDNISSNAPGDGVVKESSFGNNGLNGDFSLITSSVTFNTLVLDANTSYTLTATIDTDANVELIGVPEPQMLVLLSMGLIGLGTVAKRKNA